MATFVRTKSQCWKAIIRHRGYKTRCRTFHLKRDAVRWVCQVENDMLLHEKAPGAGKPLLFRDAMARYLAEVSVRKSSRTHYVDHTRSKPLLAFFGNIPLTQITPDLAASYREHRLQSKREDPRDPIFQMPETLAPATVRLEMSLLSHLFLIAIREWHIGLNANPLSFVQRPPPSPGRTRRLSRQEERRLLREADRYCNPMTGWIIRIAIETGMRRQEICSLQMHQVDLHRRIIHLTTTKNGDARTIPLSLPAVEALSRAIAHPNRPANSDYIFFGQANVGQCHGIYSFWAGWDHVRRQAGLATLRFHDLRHEAISRLVEGGLGDMEVASISGHRSMQMLRRYTHLRAEHLVKRLDQLARRKSHASTRGLRTEFVTSDPDNDQNDHEDS
ncbi:site-specific integrase [Thermomonas sp.]|uniref:site-specific integrase n=1 Tax=Thermomonas sp. TaxID=1971895 RepID=UPI002C46B454|nr:site-specific integrase [Thermomonas sp.]HRO63608.1 site-specific integrase [Thermomonas sp.]